jgi:hypothetical protein
MHNHIRLVDRAPLDGKKLRFHMMQLSTLRCQSYVATLRSEKQATDRPR